MDLAQKKWELENKVKEIGEINEDEIYAFDEPAHKKEVEGKPWSASPNFFQKVRISAVALLKMVTHTASGGNVEVMGLMIGRISGNVMWVMDSFALPVEGTETRVNAQQEGYEFMVNYMTHIKETGRKENIIGWYHSHPGYGCWLSGIDVATQALNQQYQEPFVAIVIDPIRTASAGKVEIGAFRTYPENYVDKRDDNEGELSAIPSEKIEDFGVHCKKYYQLEVSYFKSKRDEELLRQLWQQYWAKTLVANRTLLNQTHRNRLIADLAQKLSNIKATGHGSLKKIVNQSHELCVDSALSFELSLAANSLLKFEK